MFSPGKVNRAYRKAHSIGGKGQNFAISCEQYGEADKITLLHFIGGRTGAYVQDYLSEKGIHQVAVEKPTRQCTTLLDRRTGDMTELIEPPGKISLKEKETLEKIGQKLVQSPRLEGIALCGSLPGGVTGSTFTTIIENKNSSTVCFLDACCVEVLKSGHVNILKVNAEEAFLISGLQSEPNLILVGKEILKKYSINLVAITNGPNGAVLLERNSKNSTIDATEFELPNLFDFIREESLNINRDDSSFLSKSLPEAVGIPDYTTHAPEDDSLLYPHCMNNSVPMINPLGAGDTCSGVFFLEYLDTQDSITSFRYGLAAASASYPKVFIFMTVSTWDSDEFIACARYGEIDQMKQLICEATNKDQLSDIPYQKISALIKSTNSSNQSALHLSAANGHLEIVEFLLQYLNLKEINATTDQGSTALHWASLNGHLAVVQKLLEFGGDATLLNASGRSSVTLAEQQSHLQVVQELLKSYDPEDDEGIDEIIDNLDENGNPIVIEKNE